MTRRFFSATVLASSLTLMTIQAQAAGFYLQEQSVSGLGAAYAGQAAMPRDASILFFNPAGIAHLDGRQANIGVHFIYPHTALEDEGTTIGGFTLEALGRAHGDGGNPGGLEEVPNAYFATPLSDDNRWWAGIGLSVPFGLGTEYDDDFFGRYVSTKADIRTIDIQPSIAYRSGWFSIGGILIAEYMRANFQQNLANDDFVRLQGDDISLGYNLGVMLEPAEGTRIGLDYRSEINHRAEGRQTTEQGSLGLDSDAHAKVKLPWVASVAIAHNLDERWTLLGQMTRLGWNNFDTLEVVPESPFTVGPALDFNYRNSWSYALGLEYKASPDWTVRAGYQFDETPTTDEFRSTINPDGDRHWISAGATWRWDDRLSFDFGAAYIDVANEGIDQTRAGGVNVVAGARDSYVLLGAAGVNFKF